MIFFGICFLLVGNFNHFIKQVESQQGMQVFLKNTSTEEEIKKIGEEINNLDGINTIDYVSQEAALESLKERFKEKAYLLEGYDVSIFKPSYIITLTDLSKSNEIQNNIEKIDGVIKITSSDETIEKLVKIAKAIKIGSYVIILILIGFSIFIISNIIKLTVYARRKEISIMKYVGATNSFIRWPFIVEGIIIGVISGTVSLGIIALLYLLIGQNISFISFLSKIGLTLLEFSDMFDIIIIVYIILGIGLGVVGSAFSMRKYLKV